jgi:hypothetical protein
MPNPVEFRLNMPPAFFTLAAAQQRRLCRCVKEVWIDIVGPNPRYARGFFARLLRVGRVRWLAPTAKHVSRLRRMLRKMLTPSFFPAIVLV